MRTDSTSGAFGSARNLARVLTVALAAPMTAKTLAATDKGSMDACLGSTQRNKTATHGIQQFANVSNLSKGVP